MTLQQLEYILALNEHGNFTKAAEACGVTQPTLSTMIQKFEQELGVALFDRLKQPIETTDIGKAIISQAQIILGESHKVKEIIEEESKSLTGKFSISLLPTIAPFLLPLILPKMVNEFPSAHIEIKEYKTSTSLEALLNREIDLAVIATDPDNPLLHSSTLYYEEFLGYIGKGQKYWNSKVLHSSDITPQDLWLLDEGHCFRDQLLRFCKFRDSASRPITYGDGSIFGFMYLVEQGYGLTFIPQLAEMYFSDRQKEHCRPFAVPRPARAIYLVWNKDFVRHSVINKIIELVKESVPKEMLELRNEQILAK